MMAVIAAVAARIGESAVARWCGRIGAVLDSVIPLVLFVVIIAALGAVVFGVVH